jgi:hypothetical protein
MRDPWRQFHSAGQDFGERKETIADEIRESIHKLCPHQEMKTLERLSKSDLETLRFALQGMEMDLTKYQQAAAQNAPQHP